jgi:predicted nucleic acid-binding protein
MDKVFIDSDIILDLVQKRTPHFQPAVDLFTLIEENRVKGFVSPLIFSNLYYILRKVESRHFARDVLSRLKALLGVLTIDEKIIQLSLLSNFNDFEDAIQYYTAMENHLDYLVTRNKNDYKEPGIVICNAKEYCALRNADLALAN